MLAANILNKSITTETCIDENNDTGYPQDSRADDALIGTTIVRISSIIHMTGKSNIQMLNV